MTGFAVSTGSGYCAADPGASDGSGPISMRREGLALLGLGCPVLFADVVLAWAAPEQLLAERPSLVCPSVWSGRHPPSL